MLFYLLVPRDSSLVFILILARPQIKSLITYYWIRSIILDYLHSTLSDSKVTYRLDRLSFAYYGGNLCYMEYRQSTSGLILFNIFINDLCANINYSKFMLFADNDKIS
jgi:hypothetical protein